MKKKSARNAEYSLSLYHGDPACSPLFALPFISQSLFFLLANYFSSFSSLSFSSSRLSRFDFSPLLEIFLFLFSRDEVEDDVEEADEEEEEGVGGEFEEDEERDDLRCRSTSTKMTKVTALAAIPLMLRKRRNKESGRRGWRERWEGWMIIKIMKNRRRVAGEDQTEREKGKNRGGGVGKKGETRTLKESKTEKEWMRRWIEERFQSHFLSFRESGVLYHEREREGEER